MAHTGAGSVSGFMAGLSHPIGGLDHVLAMVAVGLWAAQLGGKALWQVPAAFVGMMLAGAGLSSTGGSLPFGEAGILLSVLVLGALIAAAVRVPVAVGAVLVGLFAVFHGHAHGAEMPAQAGALAYMAGFALATAALHGAGMALGLAFSHARLQVAARWAGAAIVLSGAYLAMA